MAEKTEKLEKKKEEKEDKKKGYFHYKNSLLLDSDIRDMEEAKQYVLGIYPHDRGKELSSRFFFFEPWMNSFSSDKI